MKRFIVIIALLLSACGGRSTVKETSHNTAAEGDKRLFALPAIPAIITEPSDREAYLRDHYWDNLNFADTLFFAQADTSAMLQAFAEYTSICLTPDDGEAVAALMQRASASKIAFEFFGMLADEILHDPNSPLYSDELYIPVLEAQVASPLLDKYEKIAPEFNLRMAKQNRIGYTANDFRYTLADGRQSTLHALKARYTLLYFYNPDCSMCRDITDVLDASPMLNRMQQEGMLRILAVYPDEDLSAWKAHYPQMPALWINAYDKSMTIRDGMVYDLKAIPSLYLLDSEKKVLIKDTTDVDYIEYTLYQLEAERSDS